MVQISPVYIPGLSLTKYWQMVLKVLLPFSSFNITEAGKFPWTMKVKLYAANISISIRIIFAQITQKVTSLYK